MNAIVVTKTAAALIVLAVAMPTRGLAAEGAWEAHHVCNITSPERGSAPRITLTFIHRGEIGVKTADVVRLRVFDIPNLSEDEKAAFADTIVEIPGLANWSGLKATGVREKSGYALYVPLPADSQVMGPIEGGRVVKVTVQSTDGPQTFEVDLTGSAKAIASFRACAT